MAATWRCCSGRVQNSCPLKRGDMQQCSNWRLDFLIAPALNIHADSQDTRAKRLPPFDQYKSWRIKGTGMLCYKHICLGNTARSTGCHFTHRCLEHEKESSIRSGHDNQYCATGEATKGVDASA